MLLARIAAFNRVKKLGYGDRALFINTVHDDIQMDVDNDPELVHNICTVLEKVFADIPTNFERVFKKKFNVPMAGEVSFGPNLLELVDFNKDKEIFNASYHSKSRD